MQQLLSIPWCIDRVKKLKAWHGLLIAFSLVLSSCEAEKIYQTQQVVIDINQCVSRLALGQEQGCGQYLGTSTEGCFIISNHEQNSHRLPIRINPEGIVPINGEDELFGDLSFNREQGGTLSIFLFATNHEQAPQRCEDLEVNSSCNGDCVVAVQEQALSIIEQANILKFTTTECVWQSTRQALAEIICDQQDNDCDGLIDENELISELNAEGASCTTGIGQCQTDSSYQCLDGAGQIPRCAPSMIEAQAELCDGLDNDCDGKSDEIFNVGEACTVYAGTLCEQRGQFACLASNEQELENTNQSTFCDFGEVDPLASSIANEAGNGRECNGLDDDCDGLTDEHFIPLVEDCGEGSCAAQAVSTCINGELVSSCREGVANGNDDDCDGVDDDCDGRVDEAYTTSIITCGLGVCIASGPLLCENGIIRNLCYERTPLGLDDDCDEIDQDCDGAIDEGYVNQTVSCGVGACLRQGSITCQNAQELNSCVPGQASPDRSCNNIDEDCDGRFDEHYIPLNTNCGLGECAATGRTYCEQGQVRNSCTPSEANNAPDLCNNNDSDCDGLIDEDHEILITQCGVGACQNQGRLICNQQPIDTCNPQQPANNDNDSLCDNIDSDCDGRTDEGFVGAAVECGEGSCADTGVQTCINGNANGDTCVEGVPAQNDTSCDGIDDDCNGLVDEDYVRSNTNCGLGVCYRESQSICIGGIEDNGCTPGLPVGNDSTCDGIDADCDGRIDEGYQSQGISCGLGVCQRNGQKVCLNGSVIEQCVAGDALGLDQICDGIDQDCDGKADEAYQNQNTSCGDGICQATGTLACTANGLIDTCSAQDPIDLDQRCDGLDTDCDGKLDEGFISQQVTCGLGICQREGQTRCVGGIVIQECQIGEAQATDRTCDLLDNDCDGQSDEDFVVIVNVVDCLSNECPPMGDQICTTNGLDDTCVPIGENTVDNSCDGIDQDCDSSVDEDYTPPTDGVILSCGQGVCLNSQGSLSCESGSVVTDCMPFAPTGDDSDCDGLDDDCDGLIDESYSRTSICGQGACRRTSIYQCINGVEVDQCVPGNAAPHDYCGSNTDDDCDGSITNYPLGANCLITVQSCTNQGVYQCNNELDGVICIGEAPTISEELCDNQDNDCDGTIDEESLFSADQCVAANTFGICQIGAPVCVNGLELCTPGQANANGDLTCNDLDDDCDGTSDEESVNGQIRRKDTPCGTGNGCSWRCPTPGSNLTCLRNNGSACD